HDGGGDVIHVTHRVGDAISGPVVEQALQARVEGAPGKQHGAFRLPVGRDVGDILQRRPLHATVATFHQVQGKTCQAEPAPLLFQLFGGGGVDIEVDGAQLVRAQRARVLDGSGG